MMKLIRELGLLYPTVDSKQKRRFAEYECDCGNIFKAIKSNVNSGLTKSCGCLNRKRIKETKTTHGKSNTKIYKMYSNMLHRCYDTNSSGYRNYGGSGVTVCEEWINSFESFYDWCINNGYQDNFQLDKDIKSGEKKIYSPETCLFVTKNENLKHRRDMPTNSNEKYIYYDKSQDSYQLNIRSLGISKRFKHLKDAVAFRNEAIKISDQRIQKVIALCK